MGLEVAECSAAVRCGAVRCSSAKKHRETNAVGSSCVCAGVQGRCRIRRKSGLQTMGEKESKTHNGSLDSSGVVGRRG
jgi:hypothetical protein